MRVPKQPAVYIVASSRNGTLYVGVTSDFAARAYAHKIRDGKGFAVRYGSSPLVYFELFDDMASAISREKQIKGGSRARKLVLIEARNSGWRDLYADIL
jgi:putative endonuclease